MAFQRLRTSRTGRVLVVTFDNPPRHFFDERMSIELDELTRELEHDDTVGAVVFTGTDEVYMTGFHVPDLVRGARMAVLPIPVGPARLLAAVSGFAGRTRAVDRVLRRSPLRGLLLMARLYAVLDRMNRMDKVFLTAINGLALGMGCVFALACDIRVLAADKEIGMPESAIAMLAAGGGTQRLVRMLGTARALELLLAGRWLDATEAADLGLVHRVVPQSQVQAETMRLAQRLAARSPLINREIKRAVYDAGTRSFRRASRMEAASLIATTSVSTARRNLDRFVELQAAQPDPTDDVVKDIWRAFPQSGNGAASAQLNEK
ncbi:enoyl-CoA hydratase/isomerase family protein [Nocardia sp. NPDC049526]|uniref:enoyl-CoA hydratase/isomerase family protein n=1 Tax=Nocardia sp. NPDC049526 TaxID=3364316 RepID=UPI0037B59052